MGSDPRNPLDIPIGGWIAKGDLRGYALPTTGTAAALIELYKGKNGSKEAETCVIWGKSDPYVSFTSDRGPDVISVLKRSGDAGIVAFRPITQYDDTLCLYLTRESTRRVWAIVRVGRKSEDGDPTSEAEDEGDDPNEDD